MSSRYTRLTISEALEHMSENGPADMPRIARRLQAKKALAAFGEVIARNEVLARRWSGVIELSQDGSAIYYADFEIHLAASGLEGADVKGSVSEDDAKVAGIVAEGLASYAAELDPTGFGGEFYDEAMGIEDNAD